MPLSTYELPTCLPCLDTGHPGHAPGTRTTTPTLPYRYGTLAIPTLLTQTYELPTWLPCLDTGWAPGQRHRMEIELLDVLAVTGGPHG